MKKISCKKIILILLNANEGAATETYLKNACVNMGKDGISGFSDAMFNIYENDIADYHEESNMVYLK